MNSILFGLGLTDIQDWADLRIDNLRGNTIYVSSNAYMYSADFKINEEGSYSLIEHSFEADPLGLSYRRMREKNKGRTNNKQ
jgi:hypothetical protein